MRTFFKELWERLFAKTPKFFQKIRNFLASLAVLSTFVAFANTQLPYLPKWTWIEKTLEILAFAGLLGAFIAQMTQDKSQEANQNKPS